MFELLFTKRLRQSMGELSNMVFLLVLEIFIFSQFRDFVFWKKRQRKSIDKLLNMILMFLNNFNNFARLVNFFERRKRWWQNI